MSTHLAAMLHKPGERFKIESIPTPQPGPNELLVRVRAIALNTYEHRVWREGKSILWKEYKIDLPAILGSEFSGTVEAVGSSVVDSSLFKIGTRVVGLVSLGHFEKGRNRYAPFQEKVVVPAFAAAVIPDAISFADAATLPSAVIEGWKGWLSIDVSFNTKFSSSDKQGVVVWGAGCAAGMMALQTAAEMGFTVYATARDQHFDFVRKFGAVTVFDWDDPEVGSKLLNAAKQDGVSLRTVYYASGSYEADELNMIFEIVDKSGGGSVTSHAYFRPCPIPVPHGVTFKRLWIPIGDERAQFWENVFHKWLAPRLASGEFVPGYKANIVGKGLDSIYDGLVPYRSTRFETSVVEL